MVTRAVKPTLWQFWEDPDGGSMPEWIRLCRETVKRHAGEDFEIRLLNERTVQELLPNVGPVIAKVRDLNVKAHSHGSSRSIGIRTGFYRAFLLHKFGGMWLDTDAILFRSPLSLYRSIQPPGFAAAKLYMKRIRVSNGMLMAWPGSRFALAYCQKLQWMLGKSVLQKWGAPGTHLLVQLVKHMPDDIHLLTSSRFHPILSTQRKALLHPGYSDDWIHEDTVGCLLYNSGMPEVRLQTPAGDKTLLGALLQRALED